MYKLFNVVHNRQMSANSTALNAGENSDTDRPWLNTEPHTNQVRVVMSSEQIYVDYLVSDVLSPDVRPYACGICSKTFARSSVLNAHEKTHSEKKRFVCGKCGKGFHLKANLKVRDPQFKSLGNFSTSRIFRTTSPPPIRRLSHINAKYAHPHKH